MTVVPHFEREAQYHPRLHTKLKGSLGHLSFSQSRVAEAWLETRVLIVHMCYEKPQSLAQLCLESSVVMEMIAVGDDVLKAESCAAQAGCEYTVLQILSSNYWNYRIICLLVCLWFFRIGFHCVTALNVLELTL